MVPPPLPPPPPLLIELGWQLSLSSHFNHLYLAQPPASHQKPSISGGTTRNLSFIFMALHFPTEGDHCVSSNTYCFSGCGCPLNTGGLRLNWAAEGSAACHNISFPGGLSLVQIGAMHFLLLLLIKRRRRFCCATIFISPSGLIHLLPAPRVLMLVNNAVH